MLREIEAGAVRQGRQFKFSLLAWATGWLLAFLALGFIFTLHPQTTVPLGDRQGANNLPGTNFFVTIQRQGFGEPSSDGSQTVQPGATLRAEVFSYHPIELKFKIVEGQGPLRISVNGQAIGLLENSDLRGEHSLAFIPQRPDNDRPEIHLLFEAPAPLRLSGLQLDLSGQWQPFSGASDSVRWAAGLLLALTGLIGALALRFEAGRLGWLALALSGGSVLVLSALLSLPLQVGPGGEMNALVYYGWISVLTGLICYLLAFGLLAVPVNAGRSLVDVFRPTGRRLAKRHPFIAASAILAAFNALLTGLLYSVIYLQNMSLDNIARFWDGPEYLVIAHSFYDPADPLLKIPAFAQKSTAYWGAHFPLYPFLTGAFGHLVGYVPAMLLLNYLFGTGFAIVLYRFLADFDYSRFPLWLSVVALCLPLRWLIYHTTGASEGATLFFLMLCLYQFKRQHYAWAGIWGAAIVMTRPNGIFVYIGFGVFLLWQALERSRNLPYFSWKSVLPRMWSSFNWKAAWWLSLMPLALLAVFGLYGWRYGDFLAYLHITENVKHIYPLPLLSLDINVGRAEGDFYYYLLEAAGLYLLWREKHYDLFWIGLVMTIPTVFLLHDDILRYSLPAFPLVLLIPFSKALESKPARWLAPLVLLGVLIYSWSQLNTNMVDIETWRVMRTLLQN
ncbi:MAG TPA: hypothetical protein VH186_14165 [Chloroflexia bacterium]|nr:hypothetical protein [Chloroflexia bacterium]